MGFSATTRKLVSLLIATFQAMNDANPPAFILVRHESGDQRQAPVVAETALRFSKQAVAKRFSKADTDGVPHCLGSA